MKRKRTGLLAIMLAFAFSVAFLAAARDALAVLGGPVDSVNKDMAALKATRSQVTTLPGYSVHEIASGALTLREYVSSDGIVFGIAWDGLLSPKLSYLLGAYYSQYREARRQVPPSHGKKSMRVKANDVVVEKWGHMRSMHGRAYAPLLLPAGVSPDIVR